MPSGRSYGGDQLIQKVGPILAKLIEQCLKGVDISPNFHRWNNDDPLSVFEECYRKSRRQDRDGVSIVYKREDNDLKEDNDNDLNYNNDYNNNTLVKTLKRLRNYDFTKNNKDKSKEEIPYFDNVIL